MSPVTSGASFLFVLAALHLLRQLLNDEDQKVYAVQKISFWSLAWTLKAKIHLACRDARHSVLISWAGQHLNCMNKGELILCHLVDDVPFPLKRGVDALFALVKLLHGRDELSPIDAPDDGGEAVDQADHVLRPRHLHRTHRLPLLRLEVVELGRGKNLQNYLRVNNWKCHLISSSLASCDEDTPAPLKLNIEASMVSSTLQH